MVELEIADYQTLHPIADYQTLHPIENFKSMNLSHMSFVIT
jgi:hypothetical protein